MLQASSLPISFLAELRAEVLKHSDSRMPKWKFRVAPNLIMELQPSARLVAGGTKLQIFKGFVLATEGASAAMLKSLDICRNSGAPWWRAKFYINTTIEPGQPWEICCRGGSWKGNAGEEGYEVLQRDIVEIFRGGFFDRLTAGAMLKPHCLICGKALTDPASMARFIGPECAGTSSLRVPWLIEKKAA
jgi:hypothetical protein